ncbi:hypothetical protein B0H12DRAFT_359754 [Mycena haematopus]|nr:hypothetical protein B0H12DRAFT_359754 [Mycena haematopus]
MRGKRGMLITMWIRMLQWPSCTWISPEVFPTRIRSEGSPQDSILDDYFQGRHRPYLPAHAKNSTRSDYLIPINTTSNGLHDTMSDTGNAPPYLPQASNYSVAEHGNPPEPHCAKVDTTSDLGDLRSPMGYPSALPHLPSNYSAEHRKRTEPHTAQLETTSDPGDQRSPPEGSPSPLPDLRSTYSVAEHTTRSTKLRRSYDCAVCHESFTR